MNPRTTTVIIDDELHATQSLAKLLELYCPAVKVIGNADSVEAGLSILNQLRPALVFLDIHLKNKNGFELLEKVENPTFQLVFTSAQCDYAVQAFRHHAIDYLLKPVDPLQLVEATNKAIRRSVSYPSSMEVPEQIVVSSSEGYQFIDLDKIIHIVGSGNYSTFYLQNEERVIASKNLKFFEKLLPKGQFIKAHQSHIVSLKYVKKLLFQDGGFLHLRNGAEVPLSRRRREEVMAALKIR